MRGSLFVGRSTQPLKQESIVVFIRGVGTGESRRVNAWLAAQSIDDQAAIVGQNPPTEMHGLVRGCERGVGGKRITVLDDFNRLRKIVERGDVNAPRREQLGELSALLAIARADHQLGTELRQARASVGCAIAD